MNEENFKIPEKNFQKTTAHGLLRKNNQTNQTELVNSNSEDKKLNAHSTTYKLVRMTERVSSLRQDSPKRRLQRPQQARLKFDDIRYDGKESPQRFEQSARESAADQQSAPDYKTSQNRYQRLRFAYQSKLMQHTETPDTTDSHASRFAVEQDRKSLHFERSAREPADSDKQPSSYNTAQQRYRQLESAGQSKSNISTSYFAVEPEKKHLRFLVLWLYPTRFSPRHYIRRI